MKRRFVVGLSALILLSGSLSAEDQLAVRTTDGIDYLSYDPVQIQRADLVRWIQLSPHVVDVNDYLVPESLELCVDKAPEYFACGSRNLHDPNFFRNAEVNLDKIRRRISSLQDGAYPTELQPVVTYVESIQETFLQAEEQRLAFLKTWNVGELSGAAGTTDINRACPSIIEKLKKTQNQETLYQLVSYDLQNCLNNAFRNSLGEYPETAWQGFLEKYSLHERFVDDGPD